MGRRINCTVDQPDLDVVFGFPKDTKAATFTHINGFLWKKGDSDGSN